MWRFSPLGPTAIIFGFLAAVAFGQQPSQRPIPRFGTGVELVLLDVSVLDRDRAPVRGLTRHDFTILEGGTPQRVETFTAIDLPDVVEQGAVPTAPWLREVAPDVQRNDDLSDRRIVVIVIDDATPIAVGESSLVERVARQAIQNLQPNDLAAVVYSINKRAGQEFTQDRARLWAGTDDGNLWMSPDGGVKWVSVTDQFYDANGQPKAGTKGDRIPYDRWVKRVVASAFDENTAYVAFSGYRTHNEDKTWLFVTHDQGKTWTDIAGGMNNPVFDLEEDPDNANVLYLGTDYGIFVTIDQGKNWTAFSTSAPNTVIRDLAIQKRDREMAIGTYGRGIYVADIGPIKEFKSEVFAENAHLFDPKTTIRWNRYERRGDTLGEMARADNPQVGANIYYYLKSDAQKVTVTVKDLEGATLSELTPSAKKGLQKVFWGLNRQVGGPAAGRGAGGGRPSAGPGQPVAGGQAAAQPGAPEAPNPDVPPQPMGRGRVILVDPGVYKVTLSVDGKEIATKKMTVAPDPLFK